MSIYLKFCECPFIQSRTGILEAFGMKIAVCAQQSVKTLISNDQSKTVILNDLGIGWLGDAIRKSQKKVPSLELQGSVV